MQGTEHSDKTKAVIAAIVANFIFGLSFMASRIAMQHTTPSMLLCVRFAVCVLAMSVLAASGIVRIDLKGKPVGKFLLLGLFHPILYFIGETNGINYSNSSFAGIIVSLIPVAAAGFSAIFLREKMSLSKLAWVLVSVAGVAIISMSQTSEGAVQVKGVLFLLLAVAGGAMFYIMSSILADDVTPFERTFVMMVMGFIFFTLMAVAKQGRSFLPVLTAAVTDKYVMLPIVYLSLISAVIAFTLLNYAVNYLDVTSATVFANITPIVSVIAGVLVLDEPFSPVMLLGMALILIGVFKVNSADAGKETGSHEEG